MPARQQTLKNTIDWSYGLLSEPEKIAFRRLGLFVGGWELEQAEQVVSDELRIDASREEWRKPDGVSFRNSQFAILDSDVLSLLTQLVSKSLVIVEEHDEVMRYRQLETIREYALERLHECGEIDGVTRRHADAFAAFAEQAYLGVQGSSQRRWLARLEREYANLSAALHWSFDGGGDSIFGCRIVSALQLAWRNTTSHQNDIWRWAHQASDALTDDMPARIHGGVWLGRTLVRMGLSTPEALPGLEQALACYKAAGDSYGIADAQGQVGLALQLTGQDDLLGFRMLEEALALSRSLGNTLIEHRLLKDLAFLFQKRGDFDRADALRLEAIDLCRRGGDLVNLTMLLYEHANQLLELMKFEEALRYGEEAAQMAQALDDPRLEMCARGIVTEAIRYMGDVPRAVALNEDLLVFTRERLAPLDLSLPILLTAKSLNDAGNHERAQLLLDELTTLLNATLGATHGYYGHVFDALACVASNRGDARRGARLFGAADAEMAASNERRFKNNDMEIAPYVAKARAALGNEAYEAAYAEGRAMTLEGAIEVARASTDQSG
jgi:tetratricopeptide (TPR) repeat protein